MSIPLLDKLSALLGNLIPFVIVLTVIVFVHELGHFLIARHNGVEVKTFSIGFGPELCGWTDKKGTRWKISALPFGGYVMMLGDEDATSTKTNTDGLTDEQVKKTLASKTPFQRMMVAFGGPLFNVLFTILLMIGLGVFKGVPMLIPLVQEVMPDTPAEACGLQAGDVVTGLNDVSIETFQEMAQELARLKGQDATLHYRRGNEDQTASLALYKVGADGEREPVDKLGVRMGGSTSFRKASFGEAASYSVRYCVEATKAGCQMIGRLITRKDGGQVGSLLMIGDGAKQSMSQGLFPFLSFMAMLSFSLGFFNLLPIPPLDGGNMLLNFIEMILRRPLPILFINVAYILGMGVIALLMVSAFWNDFARYGILGKIETFVRGIFRH